MEVNFSNIKLEAKSSSSESEFNDGYESDLMGDEQDRARLEKMSEKERETELYNRAEKRDAMRRKWEIKKKLKQSKRAAKETGDEAKVRSRDRKKNVEINNKTEEKRSSAMAQLKAKREIRQHQQIKKEVICEFESYVPDENNNLAKQFIPEKLSSSSQVFQFVTERQQLQKLQLTRGLIEKIIDVPDFKEVAVGCFVRVSINSRKIKVQKNPYQIAEVVEVVEKPKEYDFMNIRTKKAFRLRIGDVDDEVVRLEFISSKPFEQVEFKDWFNVCQKNNLAFPDNARIKKKQKELDKAINYYQAIAKANKSISIDGEIHEDRPRMNFAMRKRELMNEKDVAIIEGDLEKVNRIATEIQELEERADEIDKRRTETIKNIAYINERNRRKNLETVEFAIREEMRENRANISKGTYDPFIRRHTKPSIPFKTTFKEEPIEINYETTTRVETVDLTSDFKSTFTPISMPISQSLTKFAMTPKVDPTEYELHDFDIDIHIDMSNKPRPMEMTERPPSTIQVPKPMPHGWKKWEEYREYRGFI